MKYKLAVFDMDGTILNTLDDLTDSLNYSLTLNGYPERNIEEVKNFVGNGIKKLIERGVPEGISSEDTDKVHSDFTAYYKKHCYDKTRAYDGINQLLKNLKESGCYTAVVSNKADYAVQELCKRYFKGLFDYSVGEREGIKTKPAPDSVEEVLDRLKISKKDAVYIGDSDVDLMTAKNSGLDFIAVEWGFKGRKFLVEHGAEIIVSTPCEIENIISK